MGTSRRDDGATRSRRAASPRGARTARTAGTSTGPTHGRHAAPPRTPTIAPLLARACEFCHATSRTSPNGVRS
eukprot:2782000-Pyramimonas_sp.AAC.1